MTDYEITIGLMTLVCVLYTLWLYAETKRINKICRDMYDSKTAWESYAEYLANQLAKFKRNRDPKTGRFK